MRYEVQQRDCGALSAGARRVLVQGRCHNGQSHDVPTVLLALVTPHRASSRRRRCHHLGTSTVASALRSDLTLTHTHTLATFDSMNSTALDGCV